MMFTTPVPPLGTLSAAITEFRVQIQQFYDDTLQMHGIINDIVHNYLRDTSNCQFGHTMDKKSLWTEGELGLQ